MTKEEGLLLKSFDLHSYYAGIETVAKTRGDFLVKKFPLIYHGGENLYHFFELESKNIDQYDWVFYLRAAIHGNEVQTAQFIDHRLDELFDFAHSAGVGLIVHPAGNPSGLAEGLRYNIDRFSGEEGNNDGLRFFLEDGQVVGSLPSGKNHTRWLPVDEPSLRRRIPEETRLAMRRFRRWQKEGRFGNEKRTSSKIEVFLDLHTHLIENKRDPDRPVAYHYLCLPTEKYRKIIDKIGTQIELWKDQLVDFNGDRYERTDSLAGLSQVGEGSQNDLLFRFGVEHSVAPEVTVQTPWNLADEVYWTWFTGLIQLVNCERRTQILSA